MRRTSNCLLVCLSWEEMTVIIQETGLQRDNGANIHLLPSEKMHKP
jgi:hypothetical protein